MTLTFFNIIPYVIKKFVNSSNVSRISSLVRVSASVCECVCMSKCDRVCVCKPGVYVSASCVCVCVCQCDTAGHLFYSKIDSLAKKKRNINLLSNSRPSLQFL